MPFLDRHWWLHALLALGASLFLLFWALVWLILTFNIPLYYDWQPLLTGAFFLVVCVVTPIALVQSTLAARHRARVRKAAWLGALDRIPLATIHVDAAHAPDLSDEPLLLRWRPSRTRRIMLWIVGIFTVAIGVGALVFAALFLFTPLLSSAPPIGPIPYPVFQASILLAFTIFAFTFPISFLGEAFGRQRSTLFTPEGVEERTQWGRRRALRWDEARLLEVRSLGTIARQYILYGPSGRFVRWMDALPQGVIGAPSAASVSNFAPDGVSNEEMSRRLRGALAAVSARTGLSLRTFDGKLQPRKETAARSGRWGMTALGIVLLVVIVIPFGLLCLGIVLSPLFLGGYILLWQPSTSALVPYVGGGALVSAGVLTLAWMVVELVVSGASTRNTPQTEPSALPAEPFSSPTQVFALRIAQPWYQAAFTLFIPLFLTIGGIAGIMALFMGPFPLEDTHLWVGLLAGFCGLFGVVGLLTRVSFGLRKITTIAASKEGLRTRERRRTFALPWEAVETVTISTVKGVPISYRVGGDIGKIAIVWKADAPQTSQRTADITALSPADLATLVERCSGVSVQIEETSGEKQRRMAQLLERRGDV
jgi:hypothetical protein